MNEEIEQLAAQLRHELHQYGEMLALLEEQQEHLMSRRVDSVVDTVARIQGHTLILRRARAVREETQFSVARAVGHPECTELLQLIDYLAEDYRPLLRALVDENNQLLKRVQQRGRQNYLLLSRAVDLMQQFMNSLLPGPHAVVYGGTGTVSTTSVSHKLYEAVG